ncbi:MAG TPA: DAK2 domain-containing protein [Microthrixaceae bacterium]|nr:DAK2 domain-containing protein [Microthrixaceae bacterium]
MAQLSELSPATLLDVMGAVSAVLADHAEALDRLDSGTYEMDGGNGRTGPDQDELDPEESGPEEPDEPDLGEADLAIGGAVGGAVGGAGADASPAGRPQFAGTDLAATLEAAWQLAQSERNLSSVTAALHAGAVRGASGEAGRNLAVVFGALAEVVNNSDVVDAARFALCLELASERLRSGGRTPEAGTMAAVVAAAADGALSALDQRLDLGDVVIAAADEGLTELESGPVSNPDLAARGTVDSAAAGFLLVIDSLAAVVTDEPLPAAPTEKVEYASSDALSGRSTQQFVIRCRVKPLEGCGVEAAAWLESTWHEIGQLEQFQIGQEYWSAEVHTTLPGSAIEALCSVGVPTELHIGLVAVESV